MVRLKGHLRTPTWNPITRFNSTMVRLKDADTTKEWIVRLRFQFHNGSIKSKQHQAILNFKTGFQFHNGSIKSRVIISEPTLLVSFNSTMVRLKEARRVKDWTRRVMFQFHNGSIKSGYNLIACGIPKGFQFHNGSIKSNILLQNGRPYCIVSIPQWFD